MDGDEMTREELEVLVKRVWAVEPWDPRPVTSDLAGMLVEGMKEGQLVMRARIAKMLNDMIAGEP